MSWEAGAHEWRVEYATVHITLYNDNVTLDDDKYFLEISVIGKLGTCDTFHVPADAKISWRARTDTVCGPWQEMSWEAGAHEWRVEYATVTFKFDLSGNCDVYTEISGYGNVPNGGIAHFPDGATITKRARICGCTTGWESLVVEAGEGTVTWSLIQTYSGATPAA